MGVICFCDVVVRMKEVFASAEDTEIDVPKIWQYLAEVIGPMIRVDGALPLNFFYRTTESVRLSRKVSLLIADVLNYAASQLVLQLLGSQLVDVGSVECHLGCRDKEFVLVFCAKYHSPSGWQFHFPAMVLECNSLRQVVHMFSSLSLSMILANRQ